MLTRHDLPPFSRLDIQVDLNRLQADYDRLCTISRQHGEFHQRDRNSFIPLTYIDDTLLLDHRAWAGTGSSRAFQKRSPTVTRNRNPLENDRNHNAVYDWAKQSYALELAESLGNFCKISYSTLHPRGFLHAHIDFDPSNAYKINTCVRTGPNAETAVWNHEMQRIDLVHIREGESYFINTGRTHAAFNWDQTERTFLLISFKDQKVHSYASHT